MKKIIIICAVVLLAIGLLTVKFSSGKNDTAVKQPGEETTKEVSGDVSLDAALATGQDFFCTFKEKDSDDAGTIFVSGNKFRANFEGEVQGNKTQTHMAFDGDWYYVWMSSGMPFKMKADLVKDGSGTQTIQEAVKKSINPTKKAEVICMPWEKNEDILALPKGMEFTDLSTIMNNQVSPIPTASSSAGE